MGAIGKFTDHACGSTTVWFTNLHRNASVDIPLCLQIHGANTVLGNQLAMEVIFHGTTPEEVPVSVYIFQPHCSITME